VGVEAKRLSAILQDPEIAPSPSSRATSSTDTENTVVQDLTPAEQKILELCRKVVTLQNPDELGLAIQQLKAAIREHVSDAKEKMSDLAFLVAMSDERSKAAMKLRARYCDGVRYCGVTLKSRVLEFMPPVRTKT
jgi:hypothetical protein